MSELRVKELRERYTPKPAPKCHICGAEMTVQRMSASRITYGCTGATYDDSGCHYAEGRSIADDHYKQSRVTVVDVSDPDVLALVEALEARDKRNAELESDKSRVMDAMHAAVALNSAGINLTDFDECVLRLHEWSALPVYCIALYVDFIHGFISENRLLDFGYINDNGAFAARQEEKRNAELVEALEKEKGYASAYEAEKWHYHGLAESEGERANRAEARLEAAEKRIAELEARTVKLPKPISVLHRRDFNDAHRAIYAYPEADVNAALAAAGIEREAV